MNCAALEALLTDPSYMCGRENHYVFAKKGAHEYSVLRPVEYHVPFLDPKWCLKESGVTSSQRFRVAPHWSDVRIQTLNDIRRFFQQCRGLYVGDVYYDFIAYQ
jgi:hypothetical protein